MATKLTESNDGLLHTTAGGTTVKFNEKQAKLQGSTNKNFTDLGVVVEKITSSVGNSGQTPPNGNANEKE